MVVTDSLRQLDAEAMTLLTYAKVQRQTNFLTYHPGRSCTSTGVYHYDIMTVEAEAWTRFLVTGGSDDGWEAMNAMSPEIARKLQQREKEFWSDEAQRYAYIVADDQERVRLTDRKIALEEGREQGLAEKEQELVFDMLSAGFSDEQITALPSITKEKLEKYKKAYKK